MSNVSNTHNVVDFDSKKSAPFSGQRLAKVIFRTSKDSKEPVKQSQCVSVPQIVLPEMIVNSNLAAIVLESLQNYQDKIIKDLVISGSSQIHDDQISIDAIVSYQIEESAGNRLTKELVENWFDSSVSDLLTIAVASALKIDDSQPISQSDEIRILSSVSEYKKKFSALAGGKTSYSSVIADKLLKAITIAETDDEISQKLIGRLNSMKVNSVDLMIEI